MSVQSKARGETSAILLALGSLVLGFAVVYFARKHIQSIEGSVLIALLLLPLLTYLSTSGRLSEFKVPGGIEAKFAQAARESVNPEFEKVPYNDPQVVAKAGVRKLIEQEANDLDESKPIIMTMTLGQKTYSVPDVQEYLRALSHFRNFKFVLFLQADNKFVAYMPSWAMKQLMASPELADEFLHAVREGSIADVLRYPSVVSKTISTNATNAEALKEMLDKNIEALVVIGTDHKLVGVVEREQVLSRMMLSLVA